MFGVDAAFPAALLALLLPSLRRPDAWRVGVAAAAVAVATAVPLAYLTLAGRKQAMARIGQTRSGLIEDALVVAAGVAIVALATLVVGLNLAADGLSKSLGVDRATQGATRA